MNFEHINKMLKSGKYVLTQKKKTLKVQ